jgi:glucose-1-phosphate thymidylyltransferase
MRQCVKGVVLAGGTGSRLLPLTTVVNKHLLPVGRLLGSGRRWGARFSFRVQEEPGGIAQALSLAEAFASGSPVVVLLGDNIFEAPIGPFVERFLSQGRGARVLLKEVADPERYGVAVVETGRVVSIEEKPRNPRSRLCVTGIYMYDADVFEVIRGLKPSERGEVEISDVNDHYVRAGTLAYDLLPGWWMDAGTIPSLRLAGELALGLPDDALPEGIAPAGAAGG